MTIKDFLKITCEDIYAFDIESEKISEDKEVIFVDNGIRCKYIRKAKCKQSELVNKLYEMVDVVRYGDFLGKEKILVNFSDFIDTNIDKLRTFTKIWGSKLLFIPTDDKKLKELWLKEFNRWADESMDECLCEDIIKMLNDCRKAKVNTDGIEY